MPNCGDLARQLDADLELNQQKMGISFLARNAGKKSRVMSITGAPENTPYRVGYPIADTSGVANPGKLQKPCSRRWSRSLRLCCGSQPETIRPPRVQINNRTRPRRSPAAWIRSAPCRWKPNKESLSQSRLVMI